VAAGTQEVGSIISGVGAAANDIGAAAAQIQATAGDLSRQSELPCAGIDRFLANVRAARANSTRSTATIEQPPSLPTGRRGGAF
jgi:hypothetical protein